MSMLKKKGREPIVSAQVWNESGGLHLKVDTSDILKTALKPNTKGL